MLRPHLILAALSLDAVTGISLMEKFAGLWSGPVTGTPLGAFATMHMDMRPVDEGRQIFSRSDVDADNGLRFGFLIETHDGKDVLVYRMAATSWGICAIHGQPCSNMIKMTAGGTGEAVRTLTGERHQSPTRQRRGEDAR